MIKQVTIEWHKTMGFFLSRQNSDIFPLSDEIAEILMSEGYIVKELICEFV